ncbi:hypothetical protein C6W96_09450 [Streptomyces sp. CS149]|uniref:DUF4429 domain-containing protein n=1 Tax=Streptomyces sp. CS149 TaxID=2109332 RepID=UPI000D1BB24C|nr:DUF4429 domain-containing protein [Streptomyces sp. CS149]PSK72797.1 hypothetical protein C6W96_09450 [Streptomyces sp. CS149]
MGDVLAGIHATWEFDTDSVLIRFERGIRTPKLFQSLRERRIPYAALSSVTLTPGKRGTVVLRAVPRAGADPLVEAASGQLKEGCDPYRLVLPAEREVLAEYYADELRALLDPAYDGRAGFDGERVSFRWSWTGASSAKWKAGDQSFKVSELAGIVWRSPEALDGYLRLLPRATAPVDHRTGGSLGDLHGPDGSGSAGGGSADGVPAAAPVTRAADQDPAAVLFGLGYGPVHESLPFAAAVLESVRRTQPAPAASAPALVNAGRRDPADIAERIHHLGELHRAGLVTDAEYTTKKAQLLAEL